MILYIISFIKDLFEKRYLVMQLAKKDFSNMYTGSLLGVIWSFAQPLATAIVYLFVFGTIFQRMPRENIPFSSWFLCGLIPWNFFTGTIGTNTTIITSYSYLVKKINFRVAIIPLIKLISSLWMHLIFMFIMFIIFLVQQIPITICWLQYFYYLFACLILMLGLSWLLSSINVFIKDTSHIVQIVLQLLFFLTPIFWGTNMLPEKYHIYLKINPMFYIINGYRESFIYNIPFWQDWQYTLYFWGITLFILFMGVVVFKRLKPHFADVL